MVAVVGGLLDLPVAMASACADGRPALVNLNRTGNIGERMT